MATSWTLPTQAIIKDALELIGVIDPTDTISAEDNETALIAFQGILKELPTHGYHWPKITATGTLLAWSSGTPSQVAMPADSFFIDNIYYTANAQNVDLARITKAQYEALPAPTSTALYPEMVYIAPNNIGYLYPVPTANPNLFATYQTIVSDATLPTTPDIQQSAVACFGLWLAYVLCPKFKVPLPERQDIERRHFMSKNRFLSYAAENAPIEFSVRE